MRHVALSWLLSSLVIHQIFLLLWSKYVMWLNISQLKLGLIQDHSPIFKTMPVAKNIWRILNTIASIRHLGRIRLGHSGITIYSRTYSGIHSSYSAPGSRIVGMEIQVFWNEKYLPNKCLLTLFQLFLFRIDPKQMYPKIHWILLYILLFLKPQSFPQATLSQNFLLNGTDNLQIWISLLII